MRSGLAVEFEVGHGGRGLKASSVRLAPGATATVAAPFGGATAAAPSEVVPARRAAEPAEAYAEDGEPMCDVLSVREFSQEVTELLLKAVPEMTGSQMLHLRRELLQFAGDHGWTEE